MRGALLAAALLAALSSRVGAAPMPSRAAPESSSAGGAQPLNLSLPQAVAPPSRASLPASERNRPALRLEPRKGFIERGVEGSRDALIACQNGAYPGATVAAAAVQVSGGDSQPGHCYRF